MPPHLLRTCDQRQPSLSLQPVIGQGPFMKLSRWREGAGPERRKLIWTKLRVLLAAIGTLTAVAGIAVSVYGLLEFNNVKVAAGVAIIVVSTVLYIAMLSGSE
jgi:hypothetical protein